MPRSLPAITACCPKAILSTGGSILHVENELEGVAHFLKVEPERLAQVVERGCEVLLTVRQERVAPERDDKILTAWNGLMISAMGPCLSGYRGKSLPASGGRGG